MMDRRTVLGAAVGGALAAGMAPVWAQRGQTVRIAWIDALTGLTAATGQNQLRGFQFLAEKFSQNNPAGVRFEIQSFDNKLSPQETVSALQAAIDQGIRYVAQGTGSGPALAIIDFLNRYNARNPGKEVLFLNYAAVDPDLTNSRCSYWHFRLDADTSMKMEALTTFMRDQKDIRRST
jgi:branched-chain amino acid transport system substrate-binding protein